jgi:hypothetical protein
LRPLTGGHRTGGRAATQRQTALGAVILRSWRLVILACLMALVGAVFPPSAPAQAVTRPLVSVIGDSYTAAWGALHQSNPPTTEGAWWRYAAAELGWTPRTIVADPGGGYVDKGKYGTFAQTLRARPLDPATNYVLLQGGLNDEARSPEAVRLAAGNLLALIQQQAPRAVVIIVGAFLPSPSTVTPNYVEVARAIGRAAGKTRYMTGFMCSFSLAPDGRHPDAAGHRAIGHFVAWHIAHGLDNAPPLHKDSTGTFWTV